jgi:hypothetical protein
MRGALAHLPHDASRLCSMHASLRESRLEIARSPQPAVGGDYFFHHPAAGATLGVAGRSGCDHDLIAQVRRGDVADAGVPDGCHRNRRTRESRSINRVLLSLVLGTRTSTVIALGRLLLGREDPEVRRPTLEDAVACAAKEPPRQRRGCSFS